MLASAAQFISSSDTVVLAYDRAIRAVLYQDGTLDRGTLKTAVTAQAGRLGIPVFFSQPVLEFLDAQGFYSTLAAQIKQNGELFGAYRAVGQGGLPTRVLQAFGLHADTRPLAGITDPRAILQRVNDPGTAMIATTAATLNPEIIQKIRAREQPDWWVTDHAYTILSFDPAADTVELRNPWGRQPEPTGVFKLSLNDFLAGFSHITYSR